MVTAHGLAEADFVYVNDNERGSRVAAHDLDPVDLMFLAEAEGDHNIAFGFFGFDPHGGAAPDKLTIVTRGADGRAAEVLAHYALDWPVWQDEDGETVQFAEGPPNRLLVAGAFEPVPISTNFPERGDDSHVFGLKPALDHPERDEDGRYLDLDGYPLREGLDLSNYPDLVVERELGRFRRPTDETVDVLWDDGRRSRVPAFYELVQPTYVYGQRDDDQDAAGPPHWRLWPAKDERYRFAFDPEKRIYSGMRRRTRPIAVTGN
jgi:hypothetical protein